MYVEVLCRGIYITIEPSIVMKLYTKYSHGSVPYIN